MDERAQPGSRRRTRLLGAVMATALLGGSLVVGGATPPASAAPTPVVSVTPSTGAGAAGQTLAVSGSNVSTTANGGIGIYVAFGPHPDTLPADKWVNAAYYQNVAWTHPGGTGTATNKNLENDGTFNFNLTRADGSPLTAVYTTSAGTFDCTQISCGVLTFTAHGVPDRTQDTFTPVSFAPVVTTTSLPSTNRTQAYSQTLTAVGGTAPYTWSLASGDLPAGLSLSAAGVVSGSTTALVAAGTYNFTAQVTDSSSTPVSATQPLSILVKTPSVVVTPATDANPDGQTFTVTGSGFNPNPPVPGGPTGTGSYVAFGPDPALLPASPAFYQGTSYYQAAVWARLNPPSITDGQKAMNADGTFSFTFTTGGSPRALTAVYTSPAGTYDCTAIQCGILTFRSQGNADRSQDTFTPVSFAGPLSVSTASLAGGTVGASYSRALTSGGGVAPYSWAVTAGALPAGVTLNSSTGVLSGVPNTAGPTSFTVRVTDSSSIPQTATRALSIAVAHTTNPANARVGVPYSTSVAAFSGVAPYTWSKANGALPPGLSLNPTTGVVRGTPTAEGDFKSTIRVTDSKSPKAVKKNTKLAIRVAPVAITISPASLPAATVGVSYSKTLTATGGVGPYKFKKLSGSLPPKVTLKPTGVLSGTPKTAGSYSFVMQVTDKFKFTSTRAYTVVVSS